MEEVSEDIQQEIGGDWDYSNDEFEVINFDIKNSVINSHIIIVFVTGRL